MREEPPASHELSEPQPRPEKLSRTHLVFGLFPVAALLFISGMIYDMLYVGAPRDIPNFWLAASVLYAVAAVFLLVILAIEMLRKKRPKQSRSLSIALAIVGAANIVIGTAGVLTGGFDPCAPVYPPEISPVIPKMIVLAAMGIGFLVAGIAVIKLRSLGWEPGFLVASLEELGMDAGGLAVSLAFINGVLALLTFFWVMTAVCL